MKTFIVAVHYDASIYIEIQAEDEDKAEKMALAKAYQDTPWDELYAEVVHIEEK